MSNDVFLIAIKHFFSLTSCKKNFKLAGEDLSLENSPLKRKNRAECARLNYSHLNPNVVLIDFFSFQNYEQILKKFDVIVFCSTYDKKMLLQVNSYCRANSKGFIYGGGLGILGFIFLDYGESFLVQDKDGEEEKTYFIKDVSLQKENLYIELYENDEMLLEKGSFLKICGLPSFEGKTFEIAKVIDRTNIEIRLQIEKLNLPEIHNATVKILKEKEKISFRSFEEALLNPNLKNSNFDNKFESASIHLVLRAILDFNEKYGKNPTFDDLIMMQSLLEEINLLNICNEYDNDEIRIDLSIDFNENFIKKALLYLETDFPPLGSMIGAIISQEVIKFTRKFVPLKHWFFYNANDKLLNNNSKSHLSSKNPFETILGPEVYEFIKKQRFKKKKFIK